jgi:hypothetical protein
MNLFTEVYGQSRALIAAPCFDASWAAIEGQVKTLLAPDGPSDSEAGVLADIRASLKAQAKGKPQGKRAIAAEIVRLARPDANGFQDRAALLKTLVHMHHVAKKGSQSIWVVDQPKTYEKWAYDEAAGLPKDKLAAALAHTTETFGRSNRSMMSSALQLARKISMDTLVKLGKDAARTRCKIKTWFLEKNASPGDVQAVRAALVSGFKQVIALCNSNTVIFSDRPAMRAGANAKGAKASVNEGDKMPVIYIYEAFVRYGKRNDDGVRDKLWQCVKTIIHEITHKALGTHDHAYGVSGIRPGVSITVAQAIDNADSCGILALDMAGALPQDTAEQAYS